MSNFKFFINKNTFLNLKISPVSIYVEVHTHIFFMTKMAKKQKEYTKT